MRAMPEVVKWRERTETLDRKTDMWRTLRSIIEGKTPQQAENEAITFTGEPTISPKKLANLFNKQFNTSKTHFCPRDSSSDKGNKAEIKRHSTNLLN